MKSKLFHAAIVAGLTIAARVSAQPPAREVIAARTDSIIAAYLANAGPSAVSVAIMRGRDTLVLKGWGLADREAGVAATGETSYLIGSVTKQFTAVLVLRLAERGRLTLSDSIGRYLPQLAPAWRNATIAQVLNHTSGIPRDGPSDKTVDTPITPDSLIAIDGKQKLDFRPGTKWNYSNTGYFVLGMIVEKLYGHPFAQVIQDELAQPLGLTHTRWCEDPPATGRAKGYVRPSAAPTFKPVEIRIDMSHAFSAGALCSTVGDLAAWNFALHTGKVLRDDSYRRMTTPEGAAREASYGFGVGIDTMEGHAFVTHGGSAPGFYTQNAWFVNDSVSVVAIINTRTETGLGITRLVRAALGLPVAIATPELTLDAKQLARYAGKYAVKVDGRTTTLRVRVDKGVLRVQRSGEDELSLFTAGPDSFGSPDDPTFRLTFRLESGAVARVVLVRDGHMFEGVPIR